MSTPHADAVIIGAGIAGLACATMLTRAGLDVAILEAEDQVGGRMRTDRVDGFTIDRGFQVLNTAYPEARRILDLHSLDLRPFDKAVEVGADGSVHRLAPPWPNPSEAARAALTAPLGGLRGRLALARYAATAALLPAQRIRAARDRPAITALHEAGVGGPPLESLIGPFLTGVLLDPSLETSSRFVAMMARMFARGHAVLPAGGIQQIPQQLADRLPTAALHTGHTVTDLSPGTVHTDHGDFNAPMTIVATDGTSAAALLGERITAPTWHAVTTIYHATDEAPSSRPTLRIPGERARLLNSVVLTAAAPTYSTDGRALVATSVLPSAQHHGLDNSLRDRLNRLWLTDTRRWETVAVREIRQALPAMPAPHPFRRMVKLNENLYLCGDHRDTSSIQGALVSGRRTAQAILAGR